MVLGDRHLKYRLLGPFGQQSSTTESQGFVILRGVGGLEIQAVPLGLQISPKQDLFLYTVGPKTGVIYILGALIRLTLPKIHKQAHRRPYMEDSSLKGPSPLPC